MADEEKIVVWFEPENFSSGYSDTQVGLFYILVS